MCDSVSIYVRGENCQSLLFPHTCMSAQRVCVFEQPRIIYSKSLTQHSRPHILDRLFSPILVEVLKQEEEKQ